MLLLHNRVPQDAVSDVSDLLDKIGKPRAVHVVWIALPRDEYLAYNAIIALHLFHPAAI